MTEYLPWILIFFILIESVLFEGELAIQRKKNYPQQKLGVTPLQPTPNLYKVLILIIILLFALLLPNEEINQFISIVQNQLFN